MSYVLVNRQMSDVIHLSTIRHSHIHCNLMLCRSSQSPFGMEHPTKPLTSAQDVASHGKAAQKAVDAMDSSTNDGEANQPGERNMVQATATNNKKPSNSSGNSSGNWMYRGGSTRSTVSPLEDGNSVSQLEDGTLATGDGIKPRQAGRPMSHNRPIVQVKARKNKLPAYIASRRPATALPAEQ
jgi:hypothetical protein